jgi:epoxyqueuosine reductase
MNNPTQQIETQAHEIGFHAVGIASIDPSTNQTAATRLQEWLSLGYQAEMGWMSDPRRQDIYQVMPGAKTVIAVALNYYTDHQRPAGAEYAKIARYAWGRDYHKVLTKKLKQLTTWLTQEFEGVEARHYVDTGPIQDKFWAQSAGIGWIGKNGNVINRQYGSWIFLGEIVTNLSLIPSDPHVQPSRLWLMPIDVLPIIRSRIVLQYYHQKLPIISKVGWLVVISAKMSAPGISDSHSLQT